ncbi:Major facilitator superfamily domain containing protein [Naviculisporaceae sp. PSN 640]
MDNLSVIASRGATISQGRYSPEAKPTSSMASGESVNAASSISPMIFDDAGGGRDVLSDQSLDPVLTKKIALVNDAIDQIGWTPYHTKLFFLNGFGYCVDSLVLLLQSVIAKQAFMEFGEIGYAKGLTIAVYVGMFMGALFWGLTADVIGRKVAFNTSLFVCSVATIVASAMRDWTGLGIMIALIGFGAGGNLILDTTVFLEYLPGDKQWALTFMAMWWGLGQAIAGFISWGFLVPAKWNCVAVEDCTYGNNTGWRYVLAMSGALVFIMAALRVKVFRLFETPKYLISNGDDRKVVEILETIAAQYNRRCFLTYQQLDACGVVSSTHSKHRTSLGEYLVHVRGLFATAKISLSTGLIWLSWAMVGLAYPLFYVFLPSYLSSRGALFNASPFETWRNYTLTNVSSVFGPVLAAYLCNISFLGRRYTMTIGAILTSAFFFAYTAVRTPAQDLGISCAIAFSLNIYYSVLYAYTPEVLPSAHRGTGNGIAVAFNRIMGILSAVIATEANTATSAPLFICGALLVVMGIISAMFPFEPYGRRSS